MGGTNGFVWLDDEATVTDNGGTVTARYVSAAITPENRIITMTDGSQRIMRAEEVLTLREVALIFQNVGAWTPMVEISRDGGSTWTSIDGGVTVGSTSILNRYTHRAYETALSGNWFQARITGDTNMRLAGIKWDVTYGGVGRNE